MDKYQAIQQSIRYARLQRSMFLAEAISSAVVSTCQYVDRLCRKTAAVARAKTSRNVFTFDV